MYAKVFGVTLISDRTVTNQLVADPCSLAHNWEVTN
jgi:hypothetical protein